SYDRKEYSDWANRRISPPFPPVFIPAAPDDKDEQAKPLKLGSPAELLYESTVKLPLRLKPSVPATVDLHESFADYHAEYSFADGAMHFERRLQTRVREIPAQQMDAYRKFTKALTDDLNTFVALATGAASPSATPVPVEASPGTSEVRALLQQGQ